MCGIAAILDPKGVVSPDALGRAIRRLEHRGPDGRGARKLGGCSLGHARLSIIDLRCGAQPMSDPSGRYWISYNGEIYNYRQLKDDLTRDGALFATDSDTEVLLAAYARWGPACLDRLRGMFAFVIWDERERHLFAARDLFGEKPLYYASGTGDAVVIASDLSALLAFDVLRPTIDPMAVDAVLAVGYVPPHRTIYKNVHTLPPGHYLTWERGTLRTERFWRPVPRPQSLTLDEAAEKLRLLTAQAVERQMVADVPVGAFLSGGLDSSTVVALMQRVSRSAVETFSVGFGNSINELPYARAVAERYRTSHHEIDLGTPDVAESLERMATVYDEPFADSSAIPTFHLCEFARRHLKVVLTGDGGDELFGGYAWYPPLVLADRLRPSRLSWMVLRLASRAAQHRVRWLHRYSGALGLASRWHDPWERGVMSNLQFSGRERQALLGSSSRPIPHALDDGHYQPPDDLKGVNRAFFFDLTSYLSGDILVKVDRAAMAHGLETRAPFLDRDLAEFALTLPVTLKVSDGQTKVAFRRAFGPYWPKAIVHRPKQGFGAPTSEWLRRPDVAALRARVFARSSPLRDVLPGLGDRYADRTDYGAWILLSLGLWLERHAIT